MKDVAYENVIKMIFEKIDKKGKTLERIASDINSSKSAISRLRYLEVNRGPQTHDNILKLAEQAGINFEEELKKEDLRIVKEKLKMEKKQISEQHLFLYFQVFSVNRWKR